MQPFDEWFLHRNRIALEAARVCWGHPDERIDSQYEEWCIERKDEMKAQLKKKLQDEMESVDWTDGVLGG